MLVGNLGGLKASQRRALERTERRRASAHAVVTPELARHLTALSRDLGRQVGVLLGREGDVRSVIVGDATHLQLPDVGRLRGGLGRFRGLRLVHTHLRGEPLTADDVNDLVLLRLDLVAVVEAQADGLPGRVELALVNPDAFGDGAATPVRRRVCRDVHALAQEFDFDAEIRALESELARRRPRASGSAGRERALVVAVTCDGRRHAEMLELARAAGVEVAASVRQRRFEIHPRSVVGRGKLQEIVLEGMRRDASVALFDIELKPAQARAFEDATGLKAIDRTQLILDIFAQRATSGDGKLQVELAQLKYSLPRLTDKDAGLSRLAGGIGGRGPGETVMEVGRRRIRDRIRALERQIEALSRQREVRRRRRRERPLPILSIVGYTSAGKSTLLNALTRSAVATSDQLFMTLDPTSRRLRFPREGEVVVTDTVGFIAELPRDLVAAFRATLEELADADLLLHVVAADDEQLDDKKAAVERLLAEIGLGRTPRLLVLNKCDLLPAGEARALAARLGGVAVSAARKSGLDALVAAAEAALAARLPDAASETEAAAPAGPGLTPLSGLR